MSIKQGFLIKKDNGRITVNWQKTTSVLLNELHVDLINEFRQYLQGSLLDVGCGEKPYKLIYDYTCEKSIGIDVEQCRHDQKDVDIFASADSMPFDDESFDTVLCTNVLEHVANMEEAFREISRVLRSGGYAVISVPFLYPVHESPYDYYRFTRYGLEHKLNDNGFEVEKIVSLGGGGMFLMVYINFLFGKVLKNRAVHWVSCLIQKVSYIVYRRLFLPKLIGGRGKIDKIITVGNFIVARKV